MTRRRAILAGAVTAGLVLLAAPPGRAQLYRWTDEQGRVHYGQGRDSVPERYRPAASELVLPAAPAPPPAQSGLTAPRGDERAEIRFTPGAPIWVDARINGAGSVRLMLDTGAQVTTINPAALAQLGVPLREALRGTIRGVTGESSALFVQVDTIEVAGVTAGPIRVVAHDARFAGGEGLLGRDFLDRFHVTIDNRAGVVTLGRK